MHDRPVMRENVAGRLTEHSILILGFHARWNIALTTNSITNLIDTYTTLETSNHST